MQPFPRAEQFSKKRQHNMALCRRSARIFHFIIVILPAQQSSDETALAILSPRQQHMGCAALWMAHINIFTSGDVSVTCAASRMFRPSNVKNNNNDTQKMRA